MTPAQSSVAGEIRERGSPEHSIWNNRARGAAANGTREIPVREILAVGNVRNTTARGVDELAASIRVRGILEPVLLVPINVTGDRNPVRYRLVAGFRRVAAAKSVGLQSVPARVLELSPTEIVETRLLENLQRKDLSPIEEARAFKQYLAFSKLSQTDAAARLGISQPRISNTLRLLSLPEEIQDLIDKGELSSSHGEALLAVPEKARSRLAEWAVKEQVSVHDLEREIQARSGAVDKADVPLFSRVDSQPGVGLAIVRSAPTRLRTYGRTPDRAIVSCRCRGKCPCHLDAVSAGSRAPTPDAANRV